MDLRDLGKKKKKDLYEKKSRRRENQNHGHGHGHGKANDEDFLSCNGHLSCNNVKHQDSARFSKSNLKKVARIMRGSDASISCSSV